MPVKVFTPPIDQRETEELILMAHGTTDDWQQEAIDQAREVLIARGVSEATQQAVMAREALIKQKIAYSYEERLKKNVLQSYTPVAMLLIFFLSPFLLFSPWFDIGLSLSELRSGNYQKMYRQRLVLLAGGLLFWTAWLYFSVSNESEQKQKEIQTEIEKADISEWEKNYYGSDSLK